MNLVFLNSGTELVQDAWSTGNLYSIQPIVNVVGTVAGWIISIVGFGIVVASILKNALAALYVANPRFWDKVDKVHRGDAIDNSNPATKSLGSVITLILGIIPNVKAITEFDDDAEVDKKQYFMKAIPTLMAQIFIGMLIVNGLPAKLSNWVGTGATYVIGSVLNNVDPIELVHKVSGSIKNYTLQTDDSQDPFEKVINKAALEGVKVIHTKYSDTTKEAVQETALFVESQLMNVLRADNTVVDILGSEDGYKVNISVISQDIVPTYSAGYKEIGTQGLMRAQATNGTVSYKFAMPCTEMPLGNPAVQPTHYIVWTITAMPVASSNVHASEMIIFGGYNTDSYKNNGQCVNLPISCVTVGKGANDLHGMLGGNISVDVVTMDDVKPIIVRTLSARFNGAALEQDSGSVPSIAFNMSDKDFLADVLDGEYVSSDGTRYKIYLRVNLTGTWTYDINVGNTKTTVYVKEIRLLPNESSTSYALTSWTDVKLSTVHGTAINSEFLTRTKINESSETPVE